ncbi:MAG: hypothetical protein M3O15_10050, partial [Acidobacteriota bacterium]|nr:hypothetical protein [Acidobacteriota bacterium]
MAEEYDTLRRGCGLVDLSCSGRLELAGADRQRFLNAYVTCDVKSLAAGEGAYGFLTSAQGRILADLSVLVHGEHLWVGLPAGQEEAAAGHLRKFLIADRVEIRPLGGLLQVALVGPQAATVLEGAAAAPPDSPWRHARATLGGIEVTVVRAGRFGVAAYTLWVARDSAEALCGWLLGREGVKPVGFEALEAVRAEAGIPRFGREFGPHSFPQETGIEDAVSYTKGCYLGQEVVARIHYRGGVQKLLRGLAFAAGAPPPAPGTPLLHEGREAGRVGTALESPALGKPVGLAIVHRRAAVAGTRLELGTGGEAEVRELPLLGEPV